LKHIQLAKHALLHTQYIPHALCTTVDFHHL